MLVSKKSILSGKITTLELPITEEQWERYLRGVELVQNIFYNLTPGQREFLISGISEEEWEASFPPETDY